MMTISDDKLKKLAKERKESNPFGKIDDMEKEFNLDESPDQVVEDTNDKAVIENDPLLGEDAEVRQAFLEQQRFDQQPR